MAGRFWSRVDTSAGPDGCWPWIGDHAREGYGYFRPEGRRDSKRVRAHRFAWEQATGLEIPDGMVVRHRCDNPPCCNPKHLQIGTVADNNRDMSERGRCAFQKGESGHNAKLTNGQVVSMRALRACGVKLGELVKLFGTGKGNVSNICTGKTYRDVQTVAPIADPDDERIEALWCAEMRQAFAGDAEQRRDAEALAAGYEADRRRP